MMAPAGHLAVAKADPMTPLDERSKALTYHPHDLLWVASREAFLGTGALPDWAQRGHLVNAPVVVRRERPIDPALVPVGLRGAARSERLGAYVHRDAVLRVVRPEALVMDAGWQNRLLLPRVAALAALKALARRLDATGLCWGPTGSAGFALATGLPVLHTNSDLDLVVRAPVPLTPAQAAMLRAVLGNSSCRVDMQIDTGRGAFSFAEWAHGQRRVLLKTDHGPLLTADPWKAGDASIASDGEPYP
jgi:phosphoribosyl-dephospho-CoA transferase